MRSDITRKQQKRSDYTDVPNIIVKITPVFCRFDQKKFWWMDKLGFLRHFSALQMVAEIFRNDQL